MNMEINRFNDSIATFGITKYTYRNEDYRLINNYIMGFEISENPRVEREGLIKIITRNGDFIIYEDTYDLFDDFKEKANILVDKIVEKLRYNFTSNIDINKLIKEVFLHNEQ